MWIEKNGVAVETNNYTEWNSYFSSPDRIVKKTMLGEIEISTVFTGVDHALSEGLPLLYETMIFNGDEEGQARYSTRAEALADHNKVVAALSRQLSITVAVPVEIDIFED